MSEKLLSLREAAKLSGVHQDYLRVLINRKSIAGVMQGRDWFVAESEIQQYLARPKKRGKKLSHTYREAPPKFTSLRPRASQFETALASTEKLNLASLLNSHSHPSFNLEGEKSIFWNKVFKHSPAVAAVSALLIFSLFQFASTKFGNEQLAGLFENFRPFFSDLFSSKSGNLEVGEPIEFSNNEPEDAVAKEVATTTPEATPTIIREVVKQVTEVVERKEVFVPADVSRLEGNVANSIDGKIAPLRAELASLSSEFFSIRGNLDTTSRVAGSSITMVTQSQRIDELDSIDIDNGATIRSGNLSINAGGITASGSLTLGENLTVSGSATFSTLTVGVSTAGYFTATSTTATSTFAGGINIENGGFIYDFSTNRVGIGTTSPATTFAVQGDVYISGNITAATAILSTSTITANNFVATAAGATSTFAGKLGVGTTTPWGILSLEMGNHSPAFVVSDEGTSTPSFIIDGGGRIGIGTSSPSAKFDVYDAAIRVSNSGGVMPARPSSGVGLELEYSNTDLANIRSYDRSNSVHKILQIDGSILRLLTQTSGYVGVGTTSPGGIFSISTATTVPAFLLNQTSTGDLLTLQDSGSTVFIVKDGGNVGVGTSSPSAKFSLTAGGTGTGRAFAIANSSNAEKVTILDNGNVGIGSTSPATYPLEVFSSAGNYVASFVNNTNGGAHGRGVYIKVEGNGSGDNTALKIEKGFSTVTTLFDVNGSTGNAYMSGTVGIGTTTPVMGKLSVNAGDTSASVYAGAFVSETGVHDQGVYIQVAGNGAGDTTAFRINKSNGGMKTIFNVDGTTELTYLTGQLGVGTTTPGGFLSVSGGTAYPAFLLNQTSTGDLFTLQDSGTTAFIVRDGGNVGVGTTNSTPLSQHRLTVAQDVVMSISDLTAAQIIAAGATNPAKKLMVGFDTTNNFGFIAAGEQAVAWRNLALQPFGGSVGIGTTTPQARINSGATPMLNIAGVSTPSLVLHDTSTAQESSIATDGAGLYFDVAGHATASNNDFIFRVGQSDASYTMSEAFRINNDKRVGVGTSSPGALFSVGGDVYAGKFGALIAAPSALFDGRNDANGETNGLLIENANSGTAAFASAVIRNSNSAGNGLRLGALGTGYTTGGVYVQDGAWIESEAGLSGGLSIGTLASAPIRFYTSGFTNERLRITESGLVGIGTSSPASLLNIGNTGAAQFTITDTDASANQKHWYLQSNAGSFAIGTSSDAYTAQTARLTINTSGQLLTEDGSVSAPAYSFANDGDVGIIRTTTNTMGFVTGGVQHVTIGPPTGGFLTPRVGIGTTTPFALLQSAVNRNLSDIQFVLTDTVASANQKHWYQISSGGSFIIGTTSDAYSAGPARLSINANGTVTVGDINATKFLTGDSEWIYSVDGNTLGFVAGGTTHMVLTPGGAFQDARLGVGTTTPFGMAHIAGNQNIEHPQLVLTNTIGATDQKHWYIQTIGGALQFGTTTDAYAMATARFSINANGTLTQNGSIALTNGDLTLSDDRFIGLGSSAGRIVFDDQTTDEIEILSANVGVGTTTPWRLLSVAGSVGFGGLTTAAGTPSAICLSADKEVVVNTGTATCTVSSARFKENIEYNDTGGLVTVRALKPASFTYKEGDGEERIGFVAEDVVEIDPRLVFTENDGTTVRGVRYEDLTAVLAQAIYELDEKLNLLASSTLVASGQSLATNAWSVDQSTGKVNVNFYGDVDLHGNNLLGVNQIVSQNGLWSINDQGRMVMKAIEVGELTVGTTEKPAGVTLFDQTTKAPYCVVVDQGAVRTLAGACGAQGQGTADSGQGIGSAAETESTNESAGTATTTPITTEPASGTTEITPTSDTSTTESTDSSTTTPAEV